MEVVNIPLGKIFLDHDFNCRDRFSPMDCTELARDIKDKGLLQPIIVRRLRTEAKGGVSDEKVLINQGFEYKIIAGHRRWTACKINEMETIDCVVRDAYTSDFDCQDINAVENLQRKELNLWEECKAIQHYWRANWTREDTAQRVQKSPGWVQTRFQLLEMPEQIQELAAMDLIKVSQIKELVKYKGNENELLQAAGKLKDHNRKGLKNASNVIRRADTHMTKKVRGRAELLEMLHHIQAGFSNCPETREVEVGDLISKEGNSILTRLLAWASGEIPSGEFYRSLQEFGEVVGISYQPPELRNVDEEILSI